MQKTTGILLFIITIVSLTQILAEEEKTGREYFDLAAGYEEKGDYKNAVIFYDIGRRHHQHVW